MIKWLLRILGFFAFLMITAGIYFYIVTKDRHPDWSVDINLNSETGPLSVGFAKLTITPEVPDTWTDKNGDAQYKPTDGDTYEDKNNNGKFDAVWIAGFQNQRPAQGVHDDLWARAIVIDNGTHKIALVSLDLIGFGADDAIEVRKKIRAATDIDYTIVTSTHTHEGPDLLGLWGPGKFKSGIDPVYQKYVHNRAAEAVISAANATRPARIRLAQNIKGAIPLVEDSREPNVLDPAIFLLHAIDAEADTTLGTLLNWSNHPETLWNKNLLLTSDFPHYVREGMERGVQLRDTLVPGFGGTCVYVNGAIGGLMTTSPRIPIPSLTTDSMCLKPTFAKAANQGFGVALRAIEATLDTSLVKTITQAPIALRAKTFQLPMHNPLYRLASGLQLLDRGYTGWFKIRSEVAYCQMGPLSFLTYPGELYPEILNGGVQAPEGADFGGPIIETPPLRRFMKSDFKMTFGLANDMIGYIIPRSQWDQEAPYTYGLNQAPYGEINSVSAEAGPIIYKECKEVILAVTGE